MIRLEIEARLAKTNPNQFWWLHHNYIAVGWRKATLDNDKQKIVVFVGIQNSKNNHLQPKHKLSQTLVSFSTLPIQSHKSIQQTKIEIEHSIYESALFIRSIFYLGSPHFCLYFFFQVCRCWMSVKLGTN